MSLYERNPIYTLGGAAGATFYSTTDFPGADTTGRERVKAAVRYASQYPLDHSDELAAAPGSDPDRHKELIALCRDVLTEGALFDYLVEQIMKVEEEG